MVKPMKQKGHVPELTPSVQDGSEVRVSLIRNQGEKLSKISSKHIEIFYMIF